MLHDPGLAAMTLVSNSLRSEAAYEKYSGQHKPIEGEDEYYQHFNEALCVSLLVVLCLFIVPMIIFGG